MKLEMICTGEEVLSGQIVDTNAAWFADAMMDLGIEMQRRITVGDRLEDLVDVFLERSRHADVILVNGGLGPTTDDMSAAAMARTLGEELVENQYWRRHLDELAKRRNWMNSAANLKQCLLPESAILVDNPVGTAPGFRVKLNRAWLFFTPGIPSEFKHMVTQQFIPFINETFELPPATRLHKLLCLGHGESSLAGYLSEIETPPGITVGYRSSAPHVEVKIFARGNEAIDALPDFTERLRRHLDPAVVAEGPASIAEEVHMLLRAHPRTLSVAESCTGGMLCNQLVEFTGSSDYFLEGLVTYSIESKKRLLGVPADILERFGAVSRETVLAMARGVRRIADSDYALAITGIAGPGGGSDDKPVGTVWLALATRDNIYAQSVLLSGRSRTLVRQMSCAVALDMLRRKLLDLDPVADYPSIERRDATVHDDHG